LSAAPLSAFECCFSYSTLTWIQRPREAPNAHFLSQGIRLPPFSVGYPSGFQPTGHWQFRPSGYVECHPGEIGSAFHRAGLPAHLIPYVLGYCGEPSPAGSLRARGLRAGGRHVNDSAQSTAPPSGLEAYGLEANVSLLRYLLVPLDLYLGQLRSRRIFPHNAIFYSVQMEKGPIGLPVISFICINLFYRILRMTARYR